MNIVAFILFNNTNYFVGKFMIGSRFVNKLCISQNFGERNNNCIKFIIIHYTGMNDDNEALSWLCNVKSQVSCHYLIQDDGTIIQLVSEDKRAWHAGISCWQEERDINSYSIGIELSHPGHFLDRYNCSQNFSEAQISATIKLCKDIIARYQVKKRYILAHSDVAPLRKQDPGEFFPWEQLAREGVGHFIKPEPIIENNRQLNENEKREFISSLSVYGYDIASAKSEIEISKYIIAFQRHFRTELIDGVADISSQKTLKRLLADLSESY